MGKPRAISVNGDVALRERLWRHTPGSLGAQVPHVTLLGEFGLDVDGDRVELPFSAQRLVAFAALQRGRLSREYVAGRLWPESGGVQALASLRTAIWRVKQASPLVMASNRDCVSLSETVSVDVYDVLDLVHRILDRSAKPIEHVDIASLKKELLPSWLGDDWVLLERERLRQLCLHALEVLCERLLSSGRYAEAVEAGLAAVSGEPLRESAQRALISVHLAEGNRGEALRQYHDYRKLLREELGLNPSSQITRLFDEFNS